MNGWVDLDTSRVIDYFPLTAHPVILICNIQHWYYIHTLLPSGTQCVFLPHMSLCFIQYGLEYCLRFSPHIHLRHSWQHNAVLLLSSKHSRHTHHLGFFSRWCFQEMRICFYIFLFLSPSFSPLTASVQQTQCPAKHITGTRISSFLHEDTRHLS